MGQERNEWEANKDTLIPLYAEMMKASEIAISRLMEKGVETGVLKECLDSGSLYLVRHPCMFQDLVNTFHEHADGKPINLDIILKFVVEYHQDLSVHAENIGKKHKANSMVNAKADHHKSMLEKKHKVFEELNELINISKTKQRKQSITKVIDNFWKAKQADFAEFNWGSPASLQRAYQDNISPTKSKAGGRSILDDVHSQQIKDIEELLGECGHDLNEIKQEFTRKVDLQELKYIVGNEQTAPELKCIILEGVVSFYERIIKDLPVSVKGSAGDSAKAESEQPSTTHSPHVLIDYEELSEKFGQLRLQEEVITRQANKIKKLESRNECLMKEIAAHVAKV